MTFDRKEISEMLKKLKEIGSPRMTDQEQGVLAKGHLLIANNLKMALTVEIEEDIDEPFVIPIKAIDYIASLPDAEVDISCKDNFVTVKGNGRKSRFATLPTDLFPDLELATMKNSKDVLEISKDENILSALKTVSFACSKDEASVYSGVKLEGTNKELSLVACDGYRLAVYKYERDAEGVDMIVPSAAIKTLLNVADEDFPVFFKTMNDKKDRIVIKASEYTIYASSPTSGKFIEYKSAFPNKINAMFTVNKHELLSTINRGIICRGSEKGFVAVLEAVKDANSLTVRSSNSVTDFNELVSIAKTDIESDVKMGFDLKYMAEALKAINEDDVMITYVEPTAPLSMFAGHLSQIILPMRLKEGA